MKKLWFSTAILLAGTPTLHANEFQDAMQTFVDQNVTAWASDPVLVAAIQAQNGQTSGYDQAKIDEMDQLWRGFVTAPDAEIIANVMNNNAADFLRMQVDSAGGAITEAFVMDAQGLNVAASDITDSDPLWRGRTGRVHARGTRPSVHDHRRSNHRAGRWRPDRGDQSDRIDVNR